MPTNTLVEKEVSSNDQVINPKKNLKRHWSIYVHHISKWISQASFWLIVLAFISYITLGNTILLLGAFFGPLWLIFHIIAEFTEPVIVAHDEDFREELKGKRTQINDAKIFMLVCILYAIYITIDITTK